MEPVLTQEELEAIYAAMKGDDVPSFSVDDVALTAGQAFLSRLEKRWNEAVKKMLGSVESILMGALGRRITVRLYPSEAWMEDDLAPSEGDAVPLKDGMSVLATGSFDDTLAIYAIDLALARKIVERRTGAAPTEGSDEKPAGLTPLETRLLRDLVQELVSATARATHTNARGAVTTLDPADVWAGRNPGEIWIIASIGVAEMGGRGLRFMAPASLFMPPLTNARELISRHLQQARITLAAELGKFSLNVAKLWHLKPGTVIPMNTTVGDPLCISIGGVRKLLGEPLVSRGNVAIRLVGRIEKGANQ